MYQQLSQHEKNLHDKAFTNNRKDPSYHELTTVQYDDGNIKRELQVPKGDTLYQFREDVKNGELPTVSWIVAPENYSDHPGAAWYGAWYISEVMDILTKNPDVWKKTIFILTYDENDGYFDHMPPFVAPEPGKKETGHTSEGIDTGIEFVRHSQQSSKNQSRESSIGLGYRVPLVIASPWSRGGWVNSEVFDHTSSLMFLEKFLEHKKGKKVIETNVSEWRRTICGDLSSVFRPYNGEKLTALQPVNKDEFVKTIHRAQFKGLPSDYKKLSAEEIKKINTDPYSSGLMPLQEKGIRSANAIPYELYAYGHLSADKKSFEIALSAGNKIFGKSATGAPFNIYAPGKYNDEVMQARSYAVRAGNNLTDRWLINHFENGLYFLRVYGPNGFYREFKGNQDDPALEILCGYEPQTKSPGGFSGNILLSIKNNGKEIKLDMTDNAYQTPKYSLTIPRTKKNIPYHVVKVLSKSYNWYDFTITIPGNNNFSRRYAGHVETGIDSKTDPFMGRVI